MARARVEQYMEEARAWVEGEGGEGGRGTRTGGGHARGGSQEENEGKHPFQIHP